MVSSMIQSVRIARFNTDVNTMCGSRFALLSSRPASTASWRPEFAQIDVMPAREQVLDVPRALTVTDQDQLSRHCAVLLSMAATNTPSNSVATAWPQCMSTCRRMRPRPARRSILRNLLDLLLRRRSQGRAQGALHRREVADRGLLDHGVGDDLPDREVARDPGPAGEHRDAKQAAAESGAVVIGVRGERRATGPRRCPARIRPRRRCAARAGIRR